MRGSGQHPPSFAQGWSSKLESWRELNHRREHTSLGRLVRAEHAVSCPLRLKTPEQGLKPEPGRPFGYVPGISICRSAGMRSLFCVTTSTARAVKKILCINGHKRATSRRFGYRSFACCPSCCPLPPDLRNVARSYPGFRSGRGSSSLPDSASSARVKSRRSASTAQSKEKALVEGIRSLASPLLRGHPATLKRAINVR